MAQKMRLIRAKKELTEIFSAGVKAVKPHKIIESKIKVDHNDLYIENKIFPLRDKIYMVGFGKAVMGMAIAMEKLLGDRLIKGIISIPRGTMNQVWAAEPDEVFPKLTGVISYQENSINNQPDNDTLKTTHDIIDMVEALEEDDTLIVLISGGGSALLSMPRPAISPEVKLDLCKKLFDSGAHIKEINTVRQKMSMVKAGGLARMAYPASVIGLILSDIIGDPMGLIASGPTVYSPKGREDIIKILRKYNVIDQIDETLKEILMSKEVNDDTLLLDNEKNYKHVQNIIIGNNSLAIETARLECLRKNLNPIIFCNNVQGLVSDVSAMYGKLCHLICQIMTKSLSKEDFDSSMKTDPHLSVLTAQSNDIYEVVQVTSGQGIVLIAGGEPSVIINGNGKGGRNQELALRFSLDWHEMVERNPELKLFDIVFLSAGTDGQDGPTDAAGAFGYSEINSIVFNSYEAVKQRYETSSSENIEPTLLEKMEAMLPESVLKNNDSYTFYSRFNNGEDLLKTGITGTNVMDLHLIYIKKSPCPCKHDPVEKDISSHLHEPCNLFDELLNDFEKNVRVK